MLKKRQSLIEVITDVKTNDNFQFRVFLVIVTSKIQGQVKINSYAQTSKIKLMRKTLQRVITDLISQMSYKQLVNEVLEESLAQNLRKEADKVISGVKLLVSKVKTIKKGVVDVQQMKEEHTQMLQEDKQTKENPEAQNLLSKQS